VWNGCLIKSPRLKHRSSRLSWRLTGLETEREREKERRLVSPARWHCPALGCGKGWGGAPPHTGVTGDGGGGEHADLGTR